MRHTLVVAILALAACNHPVVVVPEPPHPGQMTMTGSATVELDPDCVDLTMTISATSARPGEATTKARANATAVLARLREAGVAAKDLKLSSVELERFEEPNTRVFGLYDARFTIVATTRDFTQIDALMEAGADAGATGMTSRFRRADLEAQKRQVRELAIAAAKAKAEQTAHALGIELGRVVSVAENQGGMMWSNEYFPAASRGASSSIGATAQPLTLEVTIGYELGAGVGS
ncbi:MAG TPA: SIMPL domain-containing protein [Kofleriaceae bacterium]|nr:SIMPL domain-containing protein [Kofleriaceae bacterium]